MLIKGLLLLLDTTSLVSSPPANTTPSTGDGPEAQVDQVHVGRVFHALETLVLVIVDGNVQLCENAELRQPEDD